MKTNWLMALCVAAVAVMGTGCAEKTCNADIDTATGVETNDCEAVMGGTPEKFGHTTTATTQPRWTCGLGRCVVTTSTVRPVVMCSPACGGGQFCETTSGTGVCKTCTAARGCGAGEVCEPTANGGAGACRTCTATAGCGAGQVCETAANNGNGACRTCTATAGCGAGQVCETAANNGSGVCRTCTATAGCGAGQVCETAANNGSGVCRTCTATAGCGAGQFCETAANGGSGVCRTCTATQGCAAGTVCDVADNQGAGVCKTCTMTAGCGTGLVCDVSANGGQGVCKTCTATAGCVSGQVCDVGGNSGQGTCVPAPPTTSSQIAAFRSAQAGTLDPSLPIQGAFVTYVRPAVGTDPAGFFLQAEPNGPAMYVQLSNASVAVQVGDRVSLAVTQKTELSEGVAAATMVSSLTVISRSHPVQNLATANPPGLAVDLSGALISEVTNLTELESELVHINGTFSSGPGLWSSEQIGYQILTTGVQAPNLEYQLRMPGRVASELDVAQGCQFTLRAGPMWRVQNFAQPSAFHTSDLTLTGCPAPTVRRARAVGTNTVQVLFDRQLRPGSVTPSAFSIPSVTVTAATVSASGYVVTLTTTETLLFSTTYRVTVSGVQESTGTPIGASNNFADFSGFMVPGALPALVISEINYDSPLNDALEFIEIHNPGTTPVPLSNSIHLLLVDGSSTASPRAEYERYTLESVTDANGMSVTSLPAGGYVVAASATFFQQVPLPSGTLRLVINRSSSFDTDIIQNGLGDGAGLVNMDTGTLIDSVLYEGVTQQGSVFDVTTHPGRRELDFAEGTPTALSGNADLGFRFDSLQRFPHGRDTNDNNTDFVYVLKATPGGPL